MIIAWGFLIFFGFNFIAMSLKVNEDIKNNVKNSVARDVYITVDSFSSYIIALCSAQYIWG